MSKMFFISTHGSENPTKATLPLVLAKAAIEEGHEVRLALVGDAAVNVRDTVMGAIQGMGLPAYKELFDFLVSKQVSIHL